MLVNFFQLFFALFTVTTVILDISPAQLALLSISGLGSATVACWTLGPIGFWNSYSSLVENSTPLEAKDLSFGMHLFKKYIAEKAVVIYVVIYVETLCNHYQRSVSCVVTLTLTCAD